MKRKNDKSPDYKEIMKSVASKIELLKSDFPQLKNFSASKNLNGLEIFYSYKTHKSQVKAGWRANLPEPDEDGIVFDIHLWDDSDLSKARQIDTQSVDFPPHYYIGDLKVKFILFEGRKTQSVRQIITEILNKHGMKEKPEKTDN